MNPYSGKYKILADNVPMGLEVEGIPGGIFTGVVVSKDEKVIYVSSDVDNTVYRLEKVK